jgi:formamidopyrimidine-DNA glycosylase
MPELPEVETTVNDLKPHMVGKKITGVDVLALGTIVGLSAGGFKEGLVGRKVADISRRGKNLIFKLDNGKFLIVHMRMTGSLLLREATVKPEKSIRIIFFLEDGKAVFFRDSRGFGKMWLVSDANSVVGRLGPEPLTTEFTPELLGKILQNRRTPVKALLLDQTLIAGIGNMYADEALYQARIHPLQPGNTLTRSEIKRLHGAIQAVLRKGIQNKGASTETYLRPSGTKGAAHLEFQVAHRKGEECPVCGGPIERMTIHQRGAFFCPKCQKLHLNEKVPTGKTKIVSKS